MLFNSFEFMLFLPIVFLLYWFVFKPRRLQNLFLVVASYVFYGWWDWRFLWLIALTSFSSYVSGILIQRHEGQRHIQRLVSASNIILNLVILAVFKYYNFFMDNLAFLFSSVGYRLDWVTLDIILPVGISFYTFQALSYTIDVYRGQIRPTHDIVEFFAYISFFPQLVAGPIERATNLLPQFQRERQFDYAKAVDGMRQILWGLFKKLVIADNCASAVNAFWTEYNDLSGLSLLAIGILFTFQIYSDFSGYSDIAIGCARLFGISLKQNFNFPYFSRSIPEFWRRWHISLMTWFRDYIYFPLGGSRCARWKVIRNTLIVFFVSGLWHGANWTFICWGLYHACLIAIYILLGINTKSKNVVAQGRLLPSVREFCQLAITFFLAVVGWIIFRSENMPQAYEFLSRMFTTMFDQGLYIAHGKRYLIWGFLMLLVEWLQRDKQHALQLSHQGLFRYAPARFALYAVLVYIMFLYAGTVQTFIYFQF
jgi:D-alanyl-lipoteichoic acid acyltransferase DltB (MBOAT superfamily)